MPLYEYRCEKCRKKFEVLIFNISEKVKCKYCGSKSIKKLLSTFGISGGVKDKSSNSPSTSSSGCSASSCSGCTGCH